MSADLHYRPYGQLAGEPNVIVDGAATTGTVLTLSHWPGAPTVAGYEHDLSAGMALAYAERMDLHGGARWVSNNHFDQDGLVSLFALVDPGAALARRGLLEDVAGAGDFATYRHRQAARASMVIAAYADPARTPLTGDGDGDDHPDRTAPLYEELLGRLIELCDHPERYRSYWEDEDACLTASEEAIGSGAVEITEVEPLDLAVVLVPVDAPSAGGHRFGGQWASGLHPMAINNATDRFVLLAITGDRYQLTYRYESWVQHRTRRPRARVDLTDLAAELTALETGTGRWVFDGVDMITPRLRLTGDGGSTIAPDDFRRRVEAALARGEPAWNPYG